MIIIEFKKKFPLIFVSTRFLLCS